VQPRYPLAAVLLLALTLAPLAGLPGFGRSAYAQTVHESGARVRSWWSGLYTVAASNENEQKDREDRREHGNNANDNNSNGNDDDGDSNDNNDCCAPPPPPPPAREAAPPPPPSSQNQASACLNSGGSVTLQLSDGTVTAKVFQDNLNVTLERVDPGSVSPPPGGTLGSLVFRLSAAPCGGSGLSALPGEGNLGVGYRDSVVSGKDESKLKLMYWDGQRWTEAPKQAADPGANYVSATISALGVYALSAP
jgi:hypothetical protein